MINKTNLQISILFFTIVLSACSSTKNKEIAGIDESLIVPPSLAIPEDIKPTSASVKAEPIEKQSPKIASSASKAASSVPKTAAPTNAGVVTKTSTSTGLYYIIVGTYPNQVDAIGTFSRISSLGLEQPAMESRRTKSGVLLHMVRLGPYSNQADIDKTKNGLTSAGISGFKLVKS